MVDFCQKNAFTELYLKKRNQAFVSTYVSQTAKKLAQFFQNMGIHNVQVIHQKIPQNSISSLIAKEFNTQFKSDKTAPKKTTLILMDRSFDPFSLFAYNFSYGALIPDLKRLEKPYGSDCDYSDRNTAF